MNVIRRDSPLFQLGYLSPPIASGDFVWTGNGGDRLLTSMQTYAQEGAGTDETQDGEIRLNRIGNGSLHTSLVEDQGMEKYIPTDTVGGPVPVEDLMEFDPWRWNWITTQWKLGGVGTASHYVKIAPQRVWINGKLIQTESADMGQSQIRVLDASGVSAKIEFMNDFHPSGKLDVANIRIFVGVDATYDDEESFNWMTEHLPGEEWSKVSHLFIPGTTYIGGSSNRYLTNR